MGHPEAPWLCVIDCVALAEEPPILLWKYLRPSGTYPLIHVWFCSLKAPETVWVFQMSVVVLVSKDFSFVLLRWNT